METIEEVLIALRRIIRATDLHSSHLAKTSGMTAPQILLLRAVKQNPGAPVSAISARISLSQATVTTMLNRLESRALLKRERSSEDKRVVNVRLTDAGEQLLSKAPIPLQDQFATQFQNLPDWEQSMILTSLQRVAAMMDAQALDASPVLDIGRLDRQPSQPPTQKR